MIFHCIRLARRPADQVDLADLTDATRTGPAHFFECAEHGASNCLDMPLDPEPSTDECEAIRRRLITTDAADEAHLRELEDAIADPDTSPGMRLLFKSELDRYDKPTPER